MGNSILTQFYSGKQNFVLPQGAAVTQVSQAFCAIRKILRNLLSYLFIDLLSYIATAASLLCPLPGLQLFTKILQTSFFLNGSGTGPVS